MYSEACEINLIGSRFHFTCNIFSFFLKSNDRQQKQRNCDMSSSPHFRRDWLDFFGCFKMSFEILLFHNRFFFHRGGVLFFLNIFFLLGQKRGIWGYSLDNKKEGFFHDQWFFEAWHYGKCVFCLFVCRDGIELRLSYALKRAKTKNSLW